MLFTLIRFEIKIDRSWFLIAVLMTWSLSRKYFPDTLPDADNVVYLAMAVIAMLGFFGSLLLHELAHAVVARHFGVRIKRITLFLFGGVAELEVVPSSANLEAWIAAAGPAMSLALAFGFSGLEHLAMWSGAQPVLGAVISFLKVTNLALALFNLLPAFPLDGGRILRAVLWSQSGNILSATRTATQSGAILAYILMALGVLLLLQGALFVGLWQIVIGGFILFAGRVTYTQQLAMLAFRGHTVAELMTKNPITVSPNMTLSAFVNQTMLRKHVTFVPVLEGDVLLGHIDRTLLEGIDRENWGYTQIGDIFSGLDAGATIRPDLSIDALVDIIAKTGRRKFLVVSDHVLCGVISLSDLTRFLKASDEDQRTTTSAT